MSALLPRAWKPAAVAAPRRAIFLDRDGVLNRPCLTAGKPGSPRSLAQVQLLPGVEQAVRELREAGFSLVVVSNQPDVARGLMSCGDLVEISTWLRQTLQLDAVLNCCHDDADGCECRKPAPGLIHRAARELGLKCSASYMVGDRWVDVEAGRRAGCQTFFVDHGYAERPADGFDYRVHSLAEATQIILRGMR